MPNNNTNSQQENLKQTQAPLQALLDNADNEVEIENSINIPFEIEDILQELEPIQPPEISP
ncbi:hypothetical protein [Helicobacter sp. L8]|uniref:hypothetical protein n=1 Tax=Helicobacter sp. L8 TaxID=2316078 RepID=UPI000EB5D39D|nr:hypothetical protein [Helicobacter sp. L8]